MSDDLFKNFAMIVPVGIARHPDGSPVMFIKYKYEFINYCQSNGIDLESMDVKERERTYKEWEPTFKPPVDKDFPGWFVSSNKFDEYGNQISQQKPVKLNSEFNYIKKQHPMREYCKSIDNRMFDFPAFYEWVTNNIQNGATVAEVGIADGASLIFLAEAILNQNKKVRIIGVDNMAYGGQTQLNTIISNIGKAGLGEYIEIMALDSLNASCTFPDGSLDFVFLDSSHEYEPTKAEIRCWIPKIKDGGILAGHDYFEIDKVRKAVDETLPEESIKAVKTDNGLGVWWVNKTHKMLNEDPKFVVDRELRKMIADCHGRIEKANNKDELFTLSEHLNKTLEEFNNSKILI